MLESGWIKVYRSLTNKGFYKDSHYAHLWMHLIFRANIKDAEFMTGGETYTIKRGQLVCSRKSLAKETGIDEFKIERILRVFKSAQMIAQVQIGRSRLVTIVNYDKHQDSAQVGAQVVHRSCTHNKKEEKNKKKEKHMCDSGRVLTEREIDESFERWFAGFPRKEDKGKARTTVQKTHRFLSL